ncbi:MAG TPA: methyl-accepting chemotaxis protein [Firmicutes bacterium]|nr:methyl-accepting chemotaxis protein [Bacillota bacterium]
MYRNLKLSNKLMLGFAIVLIISTAVTAVAIVGMNRIAVTLRTMHDHPYTVHTAALRVQRNIIDMDRQLGYILTTPYKDEIEEYAAVIDELEEEVLQAFDLLFERFRGDRELLEQSLLIITDWKATREQVIERQLAGLQGRAREMYAMVNAPHIDTITASVQEIVELAEGSAGDFLAASASDAAASRNLVLILLAASYLAAVLVVLAITRGITRPIGQLLAFAREIANGNLAVDAVAYQSRDEIGVLTRALNEMRLGLREMALSVTDAVGIVSSSSQQMSAAAEETSASVAELANAANQFSGAVEGLRANAQDMADSAHKTAGLSQEGAEQIERTVRTMTEINDVVTDLAAEIRSLGSQSDEIGEIVTLITAIADQTNLLALNAAIEAARAGEQGRGFAVVAEEVRILAEQSAKAAGEITNLIQEIHNSAQNSVQRADLGAEKVKEGMEVVTQSGEMFGGIADLIQTLVQEIGEVAAASEELAAGAEEMGATTEEQSAAAEQMAASAVEVAEAAGGVSLQMARFRL